MKIDNIINETINNYLIENLIFEKKSRKKKLDNKQHKERHKQVSLKHKDIEDIADSDEDFISEKAAEAIISRFNRVKHLINIAALARLIYKDHTDEGAQSQLRKKIEKEKNDNGVTYKITKREARIILRTLNAIRP